MSLSLAGSGQISGFDPVASGFGGLVAVKHVLKTNAFTQSSVAAGANVAVDDLTITHEVAGAANRLIITAYFGSAANSFGRSNVGIAVAEDGTLIGIGAASGSRTRVGAGAQTSPAIDVNIVTMPSLTFVHTPGAGEKTYTVRAINIRSDTQTLYINRSEDDTDNANRSRAASGLVIQEVAV